jgi:hypothetical protein
MNPLGEDSFSARESLRTILHESFHAFEQTILTLASHGYSTTGSQVIARGIKWYEQSSKNSKHGDLLLKQSARAFSEASAMYFSERITVYMTTLGMLKSASDLGILDKKKLEEIKAAFETGANITVKGYILENPENPNSQKPLDVPISPEMKGWLDSISGVQSKFENNPAFKEYIKQAEEQTRTFGR